MVVPTTKKAAIVIFSMAVVVVVLVMFVNAITDESQADSFCFRFHGNVSIDGAPAPAHTIILAKIGDKTCGVAGVTAPGRYDLDVFTHPGTKEYISFWIQTSSMEYAVQADQKRTLPRSRECLLDLTILTCDSDYTVLHTGNPAGTQAAAATPVNAGAAVNNTSEPVQGYDPMLRDVVINEIMWDEKEYIELYNTLDQTLCIGNWTITRGTGAVNDTINIVIKPGAIISSHGCYLISENDATTCKPDQTSNMTLKNSGEVLQLFSGFPPISKRVDVVNRDGNWFAGKNDAVGQSMERISPGDGANPDNWHTSLGSECGRIGTPGKENSIPDRTPPEITLVNDPIGVNDDILVSFSEPIDIPTLSISVLGPYGGVVSRYSIICDEDGLGASFDPDNPLQVGAHSVHVKCRDPADNLAEQDFVLTVADVCEPTPTPSPTSAPKIVINELMPNPIGTDRGNETTELYNCGDEEVNIGGWVIENEDGDRYTIPDGKTIEPHGYYLTKKIQLDNSGGQVLLYHDGGEVDRSIEYTHPTEGLSWQRRTDGLDTDSDGDWIERGETFGVSG